MTRDKTDPDKIPESLARKHAFMKLPMEERRTILEMHAEQVADEYEKCLDDDEWQPGDIIEDY